MHPYLTGRISLDDQWSLELPFVCQQRFEENQMVLWRPGFTIWLSIWGNDTGESTETRMSKLSAAASAGKTNEKSSTNDGFTYYQYRIDEPSNDDRVPAFQGFAFGQNGHVQMSTYFDHEAESVLAETILASTNLSPPSLGDPAVLSQLCFATKLVLEERQDVGYMYREDPDSPEDSGWRFFTGTESQEFMDNPENTQMCPIAFVAEVDDKIIEHLASPNGHYGRVGDAFEREG